MPLQFGNTFRLTKTSASVAKSDGTFANLGARTKITRLTWNFAFKPTNNISIWYGQIGNTTYDTQLVGFAVPYFTMSKSGLFILESDEQMWFQWTRVAETGVESFTIQGIPLL